MKLLFLVLSLLVAEHSILVKDETISLPAYTDYSAILIWNLSLPSDTEIPTDTTIKVGDKCPECKGTGTWVSGDGILKKPCPFCKADGKIDEGDPIIATDGEPGPLEVIDIPPTELLLEELPTPAELPPVDWDKKVPPLDSSLPEKTVELKKVWSFNYLGTHYYYYPNYDRFVSASGQVYKVNMSQEQWLAEGSINICTHNSAGIETSCTNCPLTEIEVPISQLNYKPLDRPSRLPARTISNKARMGYYPVQRSRQWTYNGGNVTINHILREHNRNYNLAWLQSLSTEELNELHSDSHTGDVQLEYTIRD